MEKIKVVIASHKRPTTCDSYKNIANAAICCPASQAKDYAKSYPKAEIITHPDSIKGYTKKIIWMHKKFGEFALVDDDVFFFRTYVDKEDDLKHIVDKDTAYDIIQSTAFTAREMGAKIFGYAQNPNPIAYSGHDPFKLSGFMVGGVIGMFKGFQVDEMHKDNVAAQDFWITLINAYYNRYCFIDQRFFLKSKEGTFTSTGGIADFRNTETEKQDTIQLMQNFGDVISIKRDNPLRKRQHEFERTLTLPY